MPLRPALSIVIIAQDEEQNVARAIESIKEIASEIVLVDSGSKDRTVEIAKSLGAHCYYEPWRGYSGQKNYAVSLAKHDWILSIDADEVVSPELKEEIRATLSRKNLDALGGFRIPRLLYIGNIAIKHGGFYPDAQLRLFDKRKGTFPERKVHESFETREKVGLLKGQLLHFAYTDFQAYAKALDKYAKLSAEEASHRNQNWWSTSKLNEWIHPTWTFFYRYICRLGFLDGEAGLNGNLIYREYVRKKISYLKSIVQGYN